MLSYVRRGKGGGQYSEEEVAGGLGLTRGLAFRMSRSANAPGATTPSLPSCLSILAFKYKGEI